MTFADWIVASFTAQQFAASMLYVWQKDWIAAGLWFGIVIANGCILLRQVT